MRITMEIDEDIFRAAITVALQWSDYKYNP